MKTKRKPAAESFVVNATEPEPVNSEGVKTSGTDTNGYKPGSKLQLPLKDDGSIDWESMRESTRDKVKQAIRSTPNLANDAPRAEVSVFHPAMVSGLYDMLGSIEAAIAEGYAKIPPHIAKQVFTYTTAEKQALEGPTVRVLNKYAAEWMIKYQDEIALATILTGLTIAKVNAAITLGKISKAQVVTIPKKESEDPEVVPN